MNSIYRTVDGVVLHDKDRCIGCTPAERRRLADCGALTRGDHVLRHRAVLTRHLHH